MVTRSRPPQRTTCVTCIGVDGTFFFSRLAFCPSTIHLPSKVFAFFSCVCSASRVDTRHCALVDIGLAFGGGAASPLMRWAGRFELRRTVRSCPCKLLSDDACCSGAAGGPGACCCSPREAKTMVCVSRRSTPSGSRRGHARKKGKSKLLIRLSETVVTTHDSCVKVLRVKQTALCI